MSARPGRGSVGLDVVSDLGGIAGELVVRSLVVDIRAVTVGKWAADTYAADMMEVEVGLLVVDN